MIKFSENLSTFSIYEFLQLKFTEFPSKASRNSDFFVKSPMGEINLGAPHMVLDTFFYGRLRFWGPLRWNLNICDTDRFSDSSATLPPPPPALALLLQGPPICITGQFFFQQNQVFVYSQLKPMQLWQKTLVRFEYQPLLLSTR